MKTNFLNSCALAVLMTGVIATSAMAQTAAILTSDQTVAVIKDNNKTWNLNGYTLTLTNSPTAEYVSAVPDFLFTGGGKLLVKSVDNPLNGKGRGFYGSGVINVDELVIDLTDAPTPKGAIYVSDSNDLASGTTDKIDIDAKTVIIKGNGGIVTNNGATFELDADTLVIEAGAEGIKTAENGTTRINVKNLSVKSGLKANLDSDETANAFQSFDNAGDTAITVTEKAEIKGDIVVGAAGKTDNKLALNVSGAESVIEGAIKTVGDTTGTDVKLSDGAKWKPTDTSNVTNLNLNNAVVELNGQDVAVDTLGGEGTVLVDVTSDNMGSLNAAGAESAKLTVDMGSADNVTDENATKAMNAVQANGAQTTGYASEGFVKGEATFNADGSLAEKKANSIMQDTQTLTSGTALSLNRILMNDVRKRMGDIRSIDTQNGAWVRMDGGQLSGKSNFENKFTTVQMGIDNAAVDSPFRLGVSASYTYSDAEFNRGDADMEAFSLAGYGLWTWDNGTFVDVIGRVASADTEVTVDGNMNGDLDNVALSLSAEVGRRMNVSNLLFVEPQAELTYTYVKSSDLTLQNAGRTINYDYDAVESLIGRVGGVFGIQTEKDSGKNFYVRLSAVQEFLGDTAVTGTMGGVKDTLKTDGRDTWVEFGVGGNFALTDNTYVWADVERTAGADVDEDYRLNIGLRYNF